MAGSTIITVTGLTELNTVMKQLPSQLGIIFHDAGKQFTNEVYRNSQKVVPVKTGRLKKSGGMASTFDSEMVFYDAPYAKIVEQRRNYFYRFGRQAEPKIGKYYANALASWIRSRLK